LFFKKGSVANYWGMALNPLTALVLSEAAIKILLGVHKEKLLDFSAGLFYLDCYRVLQLLLC
jgi:hypothetical protein